MNTGTNVGGEDQDDALHEVRHENRDEVRHESRDERAKLSLEKLIQKTARKSAGSSEHILIPTFFELRPDFRAEPRGVASS